MKILTLLFIALTLSGFRNLPPATLIKSSSKWVISESSSLVVNGSTNVNSFSCAIRQYAKTDTLLLSQDNKVPLLLSGALNLSVKNFDCNNLMMTRQLRKTLKEEQFPVFQIRFLSLKEALTGKHKNSTMKGQAEINLAGVTRQFDITCQVTAEKNVLLLSGSQPIKFSDFNLEPPKKMGKLIRAKDALLVVFLFRMEAAL